MNNASGPPRFVPTLTDVVHVFEDINQPLRPDGAMQNAVLAEDQLVHRVMQRVDLVLERQLREAVSQVVSAHTQTLVPRLREEIELVVRQSVSQAIGQELPQRPPSN